MTQMPAVLSERIKTRRLDLGLTHESLAFRSGVSVATVQRAEAGAHTPNLSTLEKIAAGLDTSVGTLLADEVPA